MELFAFVLAWEKLGSTVSSKIIQIIPRRQVPVADAHFPSFYGLAADLCYSLNLTLEEQRRKGKVLGGRTAGGLLLLAAALTGLVNASGLTAGFSELLVAGFVALAGFAALALFILNRDRTPDTGLVLFTAALLNTAVQFWGGAYGPAAFLYPLLFIWMKRETVSGPVLSTAISLAVVEFSSVIVRATGLSAGTFNAGGMLRSIGEAVAAGVIPLVSLFLVEYLKEDKEAVPASSDNIKPTPEPPPEFPDDVARSLIPVLKKSTGANGIFLFIRDERGVSTLDEFVVDSGNVSSRYMTGPDDPVILALDSCSGDIVHTEAEKLSVGGSGGLPWYTGTVTAPWVTLVQFRREGKLHGFLVLDFDSLESRKASAPLLVDSAFLLSVAWERSHLPGNDGFLAICEEMARISDIRGAVHRLVSRILKTFPDTTATVAILGERGKLHVFESMGPFSEGRAGREFSLKEGFAGLAVTRREPMRRLRMGVGQKAARTYGLSDEPGRRAGSCCAVPLEDMGTVLGVVTVESESEQYFSPEDLFLLTAFATVFSLAVSRKNLQDSLKRMKENDRLTGFPLLSSFHDRLEDTVRGVRNRAWSITVLAVDICGFSEINETWGYKAGDKVLGIAARRLRDAVGKDAVFARCGADSFLVCLQEVDRVSAEAFAARIHEEFADSPVTASGRSIEVRVCIGGAVSHVDKMIKKLPGIAIAMVNGISHRPGFSSITEVDQFYERDRSR